MTRSPVTRIIMARLEGRLDSDLGRTATVCSFAEANRILYRWSLTAPTRRAEPVTFTVAWANGQCHEGRYALRHQCAGEGLLEDNITRFCEAYAGRQPVSARVAAQPEAARFAAILDACDLATGAVHAKTA